MSKTNHKVTHYLSKIDKGDAVYIDIGASGRSNLDQHIVKNSRKSIFIEPRSIHAPKWESLKSDNFVFINDFATPENIENILQEHTADLDITYVDIDIDGYDYFLLEALLKNKRPYMIVAEVNEKIPPPIKFTVKYNTDYSWSGSHFYGMSICKAYELLEKYGYDLVEFIINNQSRDPNIVCLRKDKNPTGISLDPAQAWEGCYKKPRLAGQMNHFYYNSNVDHFLTLPTDEAIKAINSFYSNHEGEYIIEL